VYCTAAGLPSCSNLSAQAFTNNMYCINGITHSHLNYYHEKPSWTKHALRILAKQAGLPQAYVYFVGPTGQSVTEIIATSRLPTYVRPVGKHYCVLYQLLFTCLYLSVLKQLSPDREHAHAVLKRWQGLLLQCAKSQVHWKGSLFSAVTPK